jgi:hypothetical protein
MERTADFHNQVADYHLPAPAGVVDNPAALDAAIDVLDVHAATCDAPIRGFLAAGEGSASWLAGRHDDLHLVERERLEAQILEQTSPKFPLRWWRINSTLSGRDQLDEPPGPHSSRMRLPM